MAAPVQYVSREARKRRTKSGLLPLLEGDVVSRGVAKRILWHSCSITADVCAAQMQNADGEPFDAANLALDIGYGGHDFRQSNPTLRRGKQSRSLRRVQSTYFSRVFGYSRNNPTKVGTLNTANPPTPHNVRIRTTNATDPSLRLVPDRAIRVCRITRRAALSRAADFCRAPPATAAFVCRDDRPAAGTARQAQRTRRRLDPDA